jgi:hypothetical protein
MPSQVINESTNIVVTLDGGVEYTAKVIGVDQDKDIAVLQLVTQRPDKYGVLPQGLGSNGSIPSTPGTPSTPDLNGNTGSTVPGAEPVQAVPSPSGSKSTTGGTTGSPLAILPPNAIAISPGVLAPGIAPPVQADPQAVQSSTAVPTNLPPPLSLCSSSADLVVGQKVGLFKELCSNYYENDNRDLRHRVYSRGPHAIRYIQVIQHAGMNVVSACGNRQPGAAQARM